MAETPAKKKMAPRTAGETTSNSNSLSISDIKELFGLMRSNEIAELQLEQQDTKIHIVSKGAHAPAPQMVPMMAGMPGMGMMGMHHGAPSPQVQAPPPAAAQPASPAEPSSAAVDPAAGGPANLKTIYSPMVGTFYGAPAPDAPNFVRVGDSVSEETVLCIIEAMKLMNEIKAETKGRIYKALVENGAPVEYNQPLFLIEP